MINLKLILLEDRNTEIDMSYYKKICKHSSVIQKLDKNVKILEITDITQKDIQKLNALLKYRQFPCTITKLEIHNEKYGLHEVNSYDFHDLSHVILKLEIRHQIIDAYWLFSKQIPKNSLLTGKLNEMINNNKKKGIKKIMELQLDGKPVGNQENGIATYSFTFTDGKNDFVIYIDLYCDLVDLRRLQDQTYFMKVLFIQDIYLKN